MPELDPNKDAYDNGRHGYGSVNDYSRTSDYSAYEQGKRDQEAADAQWVATMTNLGNRTNSDSQPTTCYPSNLDYFGVDLDFSGFWYLFKMFEPVAVFSLFIGSVGAVIGCVKGADAFMTDRILNVGLPPTLSGCVQWALERIYPFVYSLFDSYAKGITLPVVPEIIRCVGFYVSSCVAAGCAVGSAVMGVYVFPAVYPMLHSFGL